VCADQSKCWARVIRLSVCSYESCSRCLPPRVEWPSPRMRFMQGGKKVARRHHKRKSAFARSVCPLGLTLTLTAASKPFIFGSLHFVLRKHLSVVSKLWYSPRYIWNTILSTSTCRRSAVKCRAVRSSPMYPKRMSPRFAGRRSWETLQVARVFLILHRNLPHSHPSMAL
jgi:hypothetical protein